MLLSLIFWVGVVIGTLLSPFILKAVYLILQVPSLF
jgi:hypothetical protein